MFSGSEDYEVLAFMCVIVNFRSFKLKAQKYYYTAHPLFKLREFKKNRRFS